jgi:prepilin-type processing-associated H-X9-DG protein
MKSRKSQLSAFTLVELLVIVGVLALGASLLVPTLAKTRLDTQSCYCMNNMRQLGAAWLLYAQENNDKLVQNYEGIGSASSANYAGWATGWMDWTVSPDNTNTSFLTSEKYSKIAKYFNRSSSVYKCPADPYLSASQLALGFKQRARSYSMDMTMGDGNASSGPWNSSVYQQCKKMTDLSYPTPAETFTFIEEHPDSINDTMFYGPQTSTMWMDLPATLHNGGASFAFADGHSEVHKWTGSLTSNRAGAVTYSYSDTTTVGPNDPDLGWISYHASRSRPSLPAGWPMSP